MNAWRVRLQPSHPPVSKHGTAISKAAIVAHDISPKQLLAMGSGPSGVIVDYEEESEEEDEKANDEGNPLIKTWSKASGEVPGTGRDAEATSPCPVAGP